MKCEWTVQARRKFENIKIDRQQTLSMYFLRDFHMDDLFTSISQHCRNKYNRGKKTHQDIEIARERQREGGEGGGGGV